MHLVGLEITTTPPPSSILPYKGDRYNFSRAHWFIFCMQVLFKKTLESEILLKCVHV